MKKQRLNHSKVISPGGTCKGIQARGTDGKGGYALAFMRRGSMR